MLLFPTVKQTSISCYQHRRILFCFPSKLNHYTVSKVQELLKNSHLKDTMEISLLVS